MYVYAKLKATQESVKQEMDEGVKSIFDAFANTINQVELMTLGTKVPRPELDLEKMVQYKAIVGDGKDLKEDRGL